MKQKYPAAYRALQKVARQQGTTVEHVIDEINKSIRYGYDESVRTGNLQAIALWKEIPCEGILPDALEFVEYMGGRLIFESYFS